MVSLAVAVILFEGGLDLNFRELEGHSQRVVRRLILRGVPITWAGAGLLAWLLLGLSSRAAVMLGAILIVSGPTVVAPLLERARPGRRLTAILGWESTTIDPIGAIIGALVFQALTTEVSFRPTAELLQFAGNIGLGLLGGVVGTVALWLLVEKLELHGVLATEATVLTLAAGRLCYICHVTSTPGCAESTRGPYPGAFRSVLPARGGVSPSPPRRQRS